MRWDESSTGAAALCLRLCQHCWSRSGNAVATVWLSTRAAARGATTFAHQTLLSLSVSFSVTLFLSIYIYIYIYIYLSFSSSRTERARGQHRLLQLYVLLCDSMLNQREREREREREEPAALEKQSWLCSDAVDIDATCRSSFAFRALSTRWNIRSRGHENIKTNFNKLSLTSN